MREIEIKPIDVFLGKGLLTPRQKLSLPSTCLDDFTGFNTGGADPNLFNHLSDQGSDIL